MTEKPTIQHPVPNGTTHTQAPAKQAPYTQFCYKLCPAITLPQTSEAHLVKHHRPSMDHILSVDNPPELHTHVPLTSSSLLNTPLPLDSTAPLPSGLQSGPLPTTPLLITGCPLLAFPRKAIRVSSPPPPTLVPWPSSHKRRATRVPKADQGTRERGENSGSCACAPDAAVAGRP